VSFLSPSDVAELTGIARGRKGKSREQLQVDQLRAMAIAFRINARGRPIVTWEAVNGLPSRQEPAKVWQSNVLKFG
jgi:hypothetical protein